MMIKHTTQHDSGARALLQGTFLVRPGLALARCMVISAVIEGGIIKHLALDGSQLDATTLEASKCRPKLLSESCIGHSLLMSVLLSLQHV